jgi:hypothetical protein
LASPHRPDVAAAYFYTLGHNGLSIPTKQNEEEEEKVDSQI